MAEHAHRTEQQIEHVPVPTVRQTLVRTLPASTMLLIGPPLLTWWLLDVAGTLACYGLEAELATAAMAAGMVLALLIAPTLPWSMAAVPVLLTPIYFPRARRSRRCLKALHAQSSTG